VVVLLLVVGVWIATASNGSGGLLASAGIAVAGAAGVLSGRLGMTHARPSATRVTVEPTTIANPADQPVADGPQTGAVASVLDRVGTLAGQAGNSLIAAFNAGLDTVRNDLAQLGQSVGVSYPLVEYFVLNHAWKAFQADVDFMDRVVWDETDRRDEVMRVAAAAFGGLGILAMALTPRPQKGDSR
jgi:hypothetical protein